MSMPLRTLFSLSQDMPFTQHELLLHDGDTLLADQQGAMPTSSSARSRFFYDQIATDSVDYH